MWRCPHCGAPQAETARCWVCHRSSTTCSTCRHFRTSLAADVGWCAFDPKRLPLTGLEQRGCWQERPHSELGVSSGDGRSSGRPSVALEDDEGLELIPARVTIRDFVPVELLGPKVVSSDLPGALDEAPGTRSAPVAPPIEAEIEPPAVDRTSLFGDLEAY
jgi:hypothetical protein